MIRSIVAVIAGFLASALTIMLITLTTVRFFTDVPLENRQAAAASLGTSWYLFELAYTLPVGVLGGYVTARLARRQGSRHALALAGVILLMGVASAVGSAGLKPLWHDVAVTLLGAGGCVLGGLLRERQWRG